MLRNTCDRWRASLKFSSGHGGRRAPARQGRGLFRPQVEPLEGRIVPALTFTKTAPSATAHAGDVITYTLQLSSDVADTLVRIDDATPANTTFVSATQTGGATTFTVLQSPPVGGTGTFSWGATSLPTNETETFNFVVRINSNAPDGSITNTARVRDTSISSPGQPATFVIAVTNQADLAITKTGPGGTVNEGSAITYTIIVTNSGPSDAQAVTVTDTLPTGVTFGSANFSQGTTIQNGNTVTANLGTVAAGGTVTGTIVVTPFEDGSLTDTATVSSTTTDSNTQNNTASATTVVGEGAIAGTAAAINGFELSPLTDITVATFTHANGAEPASNFTATIDWDDGTTSAGTVTLTGTTYSVQGSHTYDDERNFAVKVTVTDDSATVAINATAVILEELLPDGTRGSANERFVSEVYRDMLGRKVDASGLASWSALLDAGKSQFQVVRLIQTDPLHEFLFHEVDLLYRQYLHRPSDPGGANASVQFLVGGGTVEQLATALVTSAEFNQGQTDGSNDSWLNAFYLDALGRPVDAGGQAAWDQAFASGASRAQVAAAIFASDEYRHHLVEGYYQHFLDRTADAGGLASWTNQLKQDVRDEVVLASIMDTDSHEFFNKTAS
jgi:uncharacterized repeat protein (TIGR01451 family)